MRGPIEPRDNQTPPRPPSVEAVMARMPAEAARHGRAAVLSAVRDALDAARSAWRQGSRAPEADEVACTAAARLAEQGRPSVAGAVNATGVVLHTGLGRAPLAPEAVAHARAALEGHCTLEIDPTSGERGSRHAHVEPLLTALTGAEAAMAVNNDAGAVLLALAAVARGGEVIVSRGELVEIGGGFRIPDVMAQSGATLVEVGTTNRTRAEDYRRALTERTTAILKVHPSNFRIEGFTESASLADLAAAAHAAGIPLVDDLGAGSLIDLRPFGLEEHTVAQRLAEGADLVLFSGDKLLGGPQAGIAVGRRDLIDAMKRHPLARALRCDKVTLALLEGTLRIYRSGRAREMVPAVRAICTAPDEVQAAARRLARALGRLPSAHSGVVATVARAGAGSAPLVPLPSFAASLRVGDLAAGSLAARLRESGVYGRIENDTLLLDARTLLPGDQALITAAVRAILAG